MSDPVLLIHGHPFDHTLWDPQAGALRTAGHQVITPDLRGYGAGPPPAGDVTLLSDFAADLAETLDRHGAQRAVVGGVSMGGQIAMEFHARYPERVSALVLADTSPVADDEAGRNRRTTLADRLLVEGMAGYAAEVLDQMITPYHVVEQPAVAAHVRRMMLGTDPKGAAAALRGRAQRPDYQDSLSRVRVPALVLVGDEDAFTPLDQAELIRNLIPDSELVVIDRAGHLPGLEQPERFTTALLAFLDRTRER
jgi:pimeloyl-ACP methyl ester carboxylesterase